MFGKMPTAGATRTVTVVRRPQLYPIVSVLLDRPSPPGRFLADPPVADLPPKPVRRAIEARLGGPASGSAVEWIAAPGGMSDATVWRVTIGALSYALRRTGVDDDLRNRAPLAQALRRVASSGAAFVAAPLGSDGDDRWPVQDPECRWWEAAAWKPGRPLSDTPHDPAAIAEATRGLAEFHRLARATVRIGKPDRPLLADRAARLRRLRSDHPAPVEPWGDLASTEAAILARRLPSAESRALSMLEAVGDLATEAQPIHGDARPEHFLLQDGELTGLIDFGAMRTDSVLADVARLAGELAQGDAGRRDEAVGFYETAAGTPIDRAVIAALDASGAVLAGANWLRWLGEADSPRRDPLQVAERLRSILARLPNEGS